MGSAKDTSKGTFVLLPGAGGAGFYWYRVVPLLEAQGYDAIVMDLPGSDPKAGIVEYAEATREAMSTARRVVLVAQSMGAFTAALVADAPNVRALVFLNSMIPEAGETAGAWWENTGSDEARKEAAKRGGYPTEMDLEAYFLHDVPPDVAKAMRKHDGDEAKIAFAQPCAFEAWPEIPLHVVIGDEDRLFPADFQERVARERLASRLTSLERIPGGHLAAISQPERVAASLLRAAASAL